MNGRGEAETPIVAEREGFRFRCSGFREDVAEDPELARIFHQLS